ncbi:MAG: carbamoyltransferase C-terminal domain-containing protein [Pseudonocardiaceae bacterium]
MKLLALHSMGHDTGACLYDGGRLVMAMETERLTRVKHDHRVALAVEYVLRAAGVTAASIDVLVFSTNVSASVAQIPDLEAIQRRIKAGVLHVEARSHMLGNPLPCLVVAHEAAHAAVACHVADWPQRCLVLVNEGRGTFSRNACLRYAHGALELIERDPLPWYGTGFGWSALGYLLGFGYSPSVAGRVMAMAGHGTESPAATALLGSIDRDVHHLPRQRQRQHIAPLVDYLDRNRDFGARADLMGSFQQLFSATVAEYCRDRLARSEGDGLALSGGCALNLDANSVIRRELAPQLAIPPNCNDAGQAFGAAVYALQVHFGVRPEPFDVYRCGRPLDAGQAQQAAAGAGLRITDGDPAAIARRLAEGDVVALAHGPAELGPRALGNRSLLASASVAGMKRRVSERIKQREWFRPLACVLREERFAQIFPGQAPSPHMLFNFAMPPGLAPEATHVDGTSRVQTVARTANPVLHAILEAYERETGAAALINTSLNGAGRAIALEPADVLDDFIASDVDVFVFDGLMARP